MSNMYNVSVSYYTDDIDPKYYNEFGFRPIPTYQPFDLVTALSEATYLERAKKETLKVELIDIPRYIKDNELQEVTNPQFFAMHGNPTSDGLLSNEIFGITQRDRAGTFAYIDLKEWFIHPACYKALLRLDNKFSFIVKGLKSYKINDYGQIVEDENGGTGLQWLKRNFSKIKFKKTGSRIRDMRIKFISHNYEAGRMWINKWLVIPPYYRDVNSTTGKSKGVGVINTFYVNLLSATRALADNDNYGLSMADNTCARVQDTLKAIYDWFCGNTNETIGDDKGTGLRGKFGLIRMNAAYTSDYSSRLVVSAPELKVETIDDMMADINKSAVPLAACAADFFPYMIFHMRKFFENELLNVTDYIVLNDKNELVHVELDNVMNAFSDDVLTDELKKFVYSHDTRFRPVELPVKNNDTGKPFYMAFSGKRWSTVGEIKTSEDPIVNRYLTWVDVIYIAAVKATEDKMCSITRFPYDSYFNTIYTGIEVASTIETEPVTINGEYYKFYPKIRQEDINTPSGNKFIDTMRVSNLYLNLMGMDYDGDTISVKGSYTKESNEELKTFADSKKNFITLGCENGRVSEKEAVQALYNMTLILSDDLSKMTTPTF